MTQLNFVAGRQRLDGWRKLLLGAAALGLIAGGAMWLLQARVHAQLEEDLQRARPRAAYVAPLSASAQREQEQQMKVAQEAVRQLNLPITRLLKLVQAPRDIHVALLALDINSKPDDAPAGALKISALAETPQDMMNYMAWMSEQSLFNGVYLVKHEQDDSHAYRFQLEAQWRD